tara:strand:+ start:510 stop:677 length:168 start_codon:yes stop_codon:yes gene_type:complete
MIPDGILVSTLVASLVLYYASFVLPVIFLASVLENETTYKQEEAERHKKKRMREK